jgi:hypothetical protein
VADGGASDPCHCGRPVHVYEDGFERGLCEECSTYRCDIEPTCPVLTGGSSSETIKQTAAKGEEQR